ncbi:MAG: hypothetical protein ACJA0N_001832 [Pseudohongiellaceae bacterium]|jgi:hypothetical protein
MTITTALLIGRFADSALIQLPVIEYMFISGSFNKKNLLPLPSKGSGQRLTPRRMPLVYCRASAD